MTKRRLAHANEQKFDIINNKIFELESEFPPGHPTRQALFRTRIVLAQAATHNRVKEGWPQLEDVYQEEKKDLVDKFLEENQDLMDDIAKLEEAEKK